MNPRSFPTVCGVRLYPQGCFIRVAFRLESLQVAIVARYGWKSYTSFDSIISNPVKPVGDAEQVGTSLPTLHEMYTRVLQPRYLSRLSYRCRTILSVTVCHKRWIFYILASFRSVNFSIFISTQVQVGIIGEFNRLFCGPHSQ